MILNLLETAQSSRLLVLVGSTDCVKTSRVKVDASVNSSMFIDFVLKL